MTNKPIFYFAVLFGTIGLIASDTFIPSMQSIANTFGTTVSVIQGSVAVFMLGFCLARFFASIISDGIGRKPMFILCFLLLILGSLICLFARSEYFFVFGRLLQGIGAGGSNVLARVIIRDVTENKYLAKYNSLYSMFAVTLMVFAPFIGSILQTYFDWHAAFILIASLSVIAVLLSSITYKETNQYKSLSNIHPGAIKTNFIKVLLAPNGIRYASLVFASFGFMTAWLTAGSVILQEKLHLSYMEFGYCALFVGAFYFLASYLSSKHVADFGEHKLIVFAGKLLIAPVILLATAFIFHSTAALIAIIVFSVALSFFSAGFIIPNAYSLGVKSFPEIAGMAGAFFGFAQMFGGFVYSFFISCSDSYSILPLFVALVVTLVLVWLGCRKTN